MDKNFWLERWKKKEIGFHQNDYNEFLVKYGNSFFNSANFIFVPLCGKTKDILWFYQYEKKVLGIEISELACNEFFHENNIKYVLKQEENFNIFLSYDRNIIILNGDLFELNQEMIKNLQIEIDAVYDRASLIALPYYLRKKYVEKMLELFTNKNLKYFLITMEYDLLENLQEELGPPFSVKEKEVYELYQESFVIKKIQEKSIQRNNVINSKEVLYFMEKRI